MEEELCLKVGEEYETCSGDEEADSQENVDKNLKSDADKELFRIDAVMFGCQIEFSGKHFLYWNYYAWKTSGDPSSYFEIYKRSVSPPPYGGLVLEFPKISIAMKKGRKQPECFRVTASPERATEGDIDNKLMQEIFNFLGIHHNMMIVTAGPGARGSKPCFKQLITRKINRLVPGNELPYGLPAANVITVRLV